MANRHVIRAKISLLVVLLLIKFSAAQTCYFPDGQTVAPNDIACNASASASHCCGRNAFCLDGDLCLSRGTISRGSCTDSSWGSECSQYCKTGLTNLSANLLRCSTSEPVFVCGPEAASGSAAPVGCDDPTQRFSITGGTNVILRESQLVNVQGDQGTTLEVSPDQVIYAKLVTTLATTTATVTATAIATYTLAPTSISDNLSGYYTPRDVAGVAVGSGAPLLLALVGAVLIILKLRKKLQILRVDETADSMPMAWLSKRVSPTPAKPNSGLDLLPRSSLSVKDRRISL